MSTLNKTQTLSKGILIAIMLMLGFGVANAKPNKLNVAYFLEWPSANQVAQVNKVYDKRMGLKVKWKAFDNGSEMVAAMVSGDIDIAYSNGFVPYTLGVTKGAPIRLIGVAMTYAENDNCVVHRDAGITKANAKKLEGKKVGSPTGNVTHYKLLRTLEHLGVNPKKVRIVSMSNADASAALARGDVAMACGFGGSLIRMKKYGKVLMTGTEQEAIGLKVFDVINVTNSFADRYPEVVQQFMQITEDSNKAYNKAPGRYYRTLARASGMKLSDTVSTLKKFTFLDTATQLNDDWLGSGVQKFTKEVADFYVAQGQIKRAKSLEEYSRFVDPSFLRNVER